MIHDAAAPEARVKPWLIAPIRPRSTIRKVVDATSTRAFLALCAAMGASNALSIMTSPPNSLRDWRLIVLLVVVFAVLALIGVYVEAALIRFFGRLMGSLTSRERVRKAIAWGAVPIAWGALASALLLVVQWWMGNTLLSRAVNLSLGVAAIWSFVVTVAMLMEVQRLSAVRTFVCYAGALLIVLVIALPIRIFLWQPFNIPSGAQAPTLIAGDYLFVSKYSYGYSKYSFPFGLNLFSGRVFFSEPHRGDVIVFKTPKDNSTDFIKRLVGLPGDKIQMIDGVLNINGVPVKRERIDDRVEDVRCGYQIEHMAVHQYLEILPDGKSYLTQKLSETCQFDRNEMADNTEVFVVPPQHYFMMGDNRDDSADSRFHIGNGVGYVPVENLVGRAEIIYMSISEHGSGRIERLLTWVR